MLGPAILEMPEREFLNFNEFQARYREIENLRHLCGDGVLDVKLDVKEVSIAGNDRTAVATNRPTLVASSPSG